VAILDFTKAFDEVPHKRLNHKLIYYDITIVTCPMSSWIERFLAERTLQVVIKTSNQFKSPPRVPQEIVLGPLRFFLYIIEIHNIFKSNVRLFL